MPLLTFKELCAELKVGVRTLRRELQRHPDFPLLWIGGTQRFVLQDVLAFYQRKNEERRRIGRAPLQRAKRLGVHLY